MTDDKNKIIANEFVIFALSTNKSPSEVTLRSAEWAIITQIDGSKSVADIAEALALTKEEAINLFAGLLKKELVEIRSTAEKKSNYVEIAFFNVLHEELTQIIGPVAPFIIDDALLEIGLMKEKYEVNKVPELVEMISDEITDEQKKVKFQQIMLIHLKKMNIT